MGVRPMATASLDQACIVAFALEHGTSAAARRFGVSDSYVRRLKRSAAPASLAASPAVAARPGLRLVSAPSVPVSRITEAYYAPLVNDVADGRSYWRCPVCHDFVRSPIGARRNDWEEEQKRLHSHRKPTPVPAIMSATPAADPAPVPPELTSVSEAWQSPISPVPPPELAEPCSDDDAGDLPVATVPHESSSRFTAVRDFLLPWLAEYWRVPLAIVVGVLLICLCL